MMITVAGMIGVGKSTVTDLLADYFGGKAYYENVENPMLEKFYTASKEEIERERYPFHLQLSFLASRFTLLQDAIKEDFSILDRSIFEDIYFATNLYKNEKTINKTEFESYINIYKAMMLNINGQLRSPVDLMIYLHADFDIVMSRIASRGRSFETEEQRQYFHTLWKNYEDFIDYEYNHSPVLKIDIGKLDVSNETNKLLVTDIVQNELIKLGHFDQIEKSLKNKFKTS